MCKGIGITYKNVAFISKNIEHENFFLLHMMITFMILYIDIVYVSL